MKKIPLKTIKGERITFENILNLVFFLTTLAGIGTSIFMNFVGRSLWLDEALLAQSFSTRTFWNLWDGSFDGNQSAPLGWLYIEKILVIIFGNTEFVLRIGSIIGFALTLVLIYLLMKNCFHVAFPLGACAFYANMPFALRYSNVFKPYICDGFFVLMVIFLFWLYKQEKINFKKMALGWAVLIWFSNPTCFFEGGLLISEGIFVLTEKNWKRIKELIATGVTIVISFIVYYFFWLRGVAENGHMQHFWRNKNFPLIPTSFEEVRKMGDMIEEIFSHVGFYKDIFYFMFIITFIIALVKKNKILIGCYIGTLITCFASYIKMFPVQDRLWCFFYPLIIIFCFWGFSMLQELNIKLFSFIMSSLVFIFVYLNTHNIVYSGLTFFALFAIFEIFSPEKIVRLKIYIIGLLAFVLVFSNDGIIKYSNEENVYWRGEELGKELDYLEQHIEPDELVYIYTSSRSGYKYKRNYDDSALSSIGGYKNNVIIGTTHFRQTDDCQGDIEKIINSKKIYIVATHTTNDRLVQLLNAVHENGYFQLVSFEYNTPLFFYCNELSDSKVHVSYEVAERSENGNIVNMILRIHNDGEAYLNHNWENVRLVNCETRSWFDLEKNIAPGQSVDVVISYEKGSDSVFRLENEYGLICEDSEIVLESDN